MPESLDLDALREKAEKALGRVAPDIREEDIAVEAGYVGEIPGWLIRFSLAAPDVLAVLALVEEQRKENERLRGALTGLHAASRDLILRRRIERILAAGSPAENKEPT